MEIMARISDGEKLQDYSIENVEGFVKEITPRLPEQMIGLDWENLPYHSVEVLSKVPAEDFHYLCEKYEKQIQREEFEKRFGEGEWFTSPSRQTFLVAAKVSMYSRQKTPDRYVALAKWIEP